MSQYGTYIGNIPDIIIGYVLSFALIILINFTVIFFCGENDMNSCERLAIRELNLAIFLQAISLALGLMGRVLVFFTFFVDIDSYVEQEGEDEKMR